MSKDKPISAGELVDLYDEGDLVSGVVLGEEKGRLRVVTGAGKEIRVAVSRIAHRAGHGPGSAADGARAARQHAEEAQGKVAGVDLTALWDVLVDEAADGPARQSLADLASLALGHADPVSRSAMLRVLGPDKIYFVRKGDDYEPRSRDHVDETLKRQVAEARHAALREEFIALSREALHGGLPAPLHPGDHQDRIADLMELATVGEEAAARGQAVALLDDAGAPSGPPAERAFHLLCALGLLREDENLFIHRFRLRRGFTDEVETTAATAAAGALSGESTHRRDLTHLAAFTIDDAQTTEMDDALSVEEASGGVTLGIHIADPATFVLPGDPVDREAMARAATFYFPETKLPMMPKIISEETASLVQGATRPTLSFLVRLSPLGEVLDHEIVESFIRSRRRMTYEEADDILLAADPARVHGESGAAIAGALLRLRPLCAALEAERIAAGAVVIRAPEMEIHVDEEGRIAIRRIDERGPSRRMVAETMILANRLAAAFCSQRSLPVLYRRQAPPDDGTAPAPPESAEYDPVAVRAQRRRMKRGEVSLAPAPHSGLGLPAYTQATSPIRRYQDLVVHRQIKANLRGEPLPYDGEALARIAATTDEAERNARLAERGTDEYWILKHYAGRVGEVIEGIIVAAEARRTLVELSDTLHTVPLPPSPSHRAGDKLRLRIESARPRAGKLHLLEEPS